MKPFKREQFLLWLLAGLLTWQAGIFSVGVVMCSRAEAPRELCPELGARFDNFVQTTLSSVLALLAGSRLK